MRRGYNIMRQVADSKTALKKHLTDWCNYSLQGRLVHSIAAVMNALAI